MEFPIQSPRMDSAALSNSNVQRPALEAVSMKPETARPVVAADSASSATATKADGFQPLDMYEVGDNDQMPIPPEPPRQSTVLAVMADARPVEEVETPPNDPMADNLREIDEGPANPTVDILS